MLKQLRKLSFLCLCLLLLIGYGSAQAAQEGAADGPGAH